MKAAAWQRSHMCMCLGTSLGRRLFIPGSQQCWADHILSGVGQCHQGGEGTFRPDVCIDLMGTKAEALTRLLVHVGNHDRARSPASLCNVPVKGEAQPVLSQMKTKWLSACSTDMYTTK